MDFTVFNATIATHDINIFHEHSMKLNAFLVKQTNIFYLEKTFWFRMLYCQLGQVFKFSCIITQAQRLQA